MPPFLSDTLLSFIFYDGRLLKHQYIPVNVASNDDRAPRDLVYIELGSLSTWLGECLSLHTALCVMGFAFLV